MRARDRRVIFLLGSGVSLSADMPGTQEITRRVLSGEGVECYRHRDGDTAYDHYFTVRAADRADRDSAQALWHACPTMMGPVIEYLAWLRSIAAQYYRSRPPSYGTRSPNYEDIYYLAAQLAHEPEFANPLVAEALAASRGKVKLSGLKPGASGCWHNLAILLVTVASGCIS